MFRLMIVEDEKITRDGLCRHIDWNSLDVEISLSVSNGLEAVIAADSALPDILLSDIKMPHMTGIELAQVIRKRFPKCKIIFLSGYADKEYLMSAIQLKAVSYIEKPVNLEEIKQAVQTAVNQLKSEQEEALIHNSFQQTRPLVNYEIVSALLSTHTDWNKFTSDYVPLYFNWNRIGCYSAACIYISSTQIPPEQAKVLASEAIEFLHHHQAISIPNCYISTMSPYHIIMVARNLCSSMIKPAFISLQERLYSTYSVDTAIAISASCMALTDLPTVYNHASTALACEMFYGRKNCIMEPPIPTFTSSRIPKELLTLQELNLSTIEELFVVLREKAYSDIGTIREELFKLYMVAAEQTWNNQLISWKEFEHLTLDEYKELIFYEMNVLRILGNGVYDIKIKKAIQCILSDYALPELSVKTIADHVGLSQNYLSYLFKNQTDSTVNDFITNIRLDEARTLLTKTDLKLYEIAERIGLSDPNYLSSLFKKQFSMTPSQYKKGYRSYEASGKD